MGNRVGFESRFKNIDNFYYDLSNLSVRHFNLWNIHPSSGKSSISVKNNVLFCNTENELQPTEQITSTFSEAIEDIKKYVNEIKNEIKKRNENDYQEIETLLEYDFD